MSTETAEVTADTTAEAPLLHSMKNGAKRLGLSVAYTYELAYKGDLETITIGRRRLIPDAALRGYVERLRQEQNGSDVEVDQ